MADILLATINAKYIHSAFGLRYLLANLGELQGRTRILEFEIKQRALDIAAEILSHSPKIVGLGVYIWNTALSTEVAAILKRVSPETILVLGGPEVSFETESQPIFASADHVITGEADVEFAHLCRTLLTEDAARPQKLIHARLPDLSQVALPYENYSDSDIAHRVLYVEASRGCPFTCEFCLSSLDVPVRSFDLDRFLTSLASLFNNGARTFKFVDRTFNLNLNTSRRILQFFLDRWEEGMFVHFEMVPDRISEALLQQLAEFPPGGVQLEVGIQTFNEETARLISRRQNYTKLESNLRYLRAHTGVHIHADLIAGLPAETLESFGRGFDRLLALDPQEIQVGLLKRLRGTPIVRHDAEFGMIYSPHPPYEILRTGTMDFETLQRVRRFSRFWDLLANSGRFTETLPLVWRSQNSPFEALLKFSDWLGAQTGRNHSIALVALAEYLYRYLHDVLACTEAAAALQADWFRGGIKRERLAFLPSPTEPPDPRATITTAVSLSSGSKRQRRHAKVTTPPSHST